jgi:hypothetical protein
VSAKEHPGVRMPADHWSRGAVHSFRQRISGGTVTTWCGLTADLSAGAEQTDDLISCPGCGQASWEDVRRSGRQAPAGVAGG